MLNGLGNVPLLVPPRRHSRRRLSLRSGPQEPLGRAGLVLHPCQEPLRHETIEVGLHVHIDGGWITPVKRVGPPPAQFVSKAKAVEALVPVASPPGRASGLAGQPERPHEVYADLEMGLIRELMNQVQDRPQRPGVTALPCVSRL